MRREREIEKAVGNFPVEARVAQNSLPVLADPTVVDADWVQAYRSRRPVRWRLWLWVIFKLALAGLVAWGLFLLPVGNLPNLLQNWKNPIVIFLVVCFIGKTMLDTFFYDHYKP